MPVISSRECFSPSYPIVDPPDTSRAARSGTVRAGKMGSAREKAQRAVVLPEAYPQSSEPIYFRSDGHFDDSRTHIASVPKARAELAFNVIQ